MSFKPEVIADSSGQWCGNALRFATREEAAEAGIGLVQSPRVANHRLDPNAGSFFELSPLSRSTRSPRDWRRSAIHPRSRSQRVLRNGRYGA